MNSNFINITDLLINRRLGLPKDAENLISSNGDAYNHIASVIKGKKNLHIITIGNNTYKINMALHG